MSVGGTGDRRSRMIFRDYLGRGGRVLSIMLHRIVLLLVLGTACAWPQAPANPDTPAGRALQMWLDVFNSGDRARIQAYVTKYDPTDSVDEMVGFREQTGGFELQGVDKSEPLQIKFHVKEKGSPTVAVGTIN